MLIEKDKSSLLIIDVQEKLVSVMPKPHTFIDNIIKLQKAAKALCIATGCSEQYPKGLGKTIKKIKENVKITFKESDQILEKTEFSIPKKFGFAGWEHLIICGIEAHVCVLQTAINFSIDKEIYVVQDAISSRYEKDYLTALGRMDKHPNIQIVTCEMVLFEWLKKSDTKEFKTISQLIK